MIKEVCRSTYTPALPHSAAIMTRYGPSIRNTPVPVSKTTESAYRTEYINNDTANMACLHAVFDMSDFFLSLQDEDNSLVCLEDNSLVCLEDEFLGFEQDVLAPAATSPNASAATPVVAAAATPIGAAAAAATPLAVAATPVAAAATFTAPVATITSVAPVFTTSAAAFTASAAPYTTSAAAYTTSAVAATPIRTSVAAKFTASAAAFTVAGPKPSVTTSRFTIRPRVSVAKSTPIRVVSISESNYKPPTPNSYVRIQSEPSLGDAAQDFATKNIVGGKFVLPRSSASVPASRSILLPHIPKIVLQNPARFSVPSVSNAATKNATKKKFNVSLVPKNNSKRTFTLKSTSYSESNTVSKNNLNKVVVQSGFRSVNGSNAAKSSVLFQKQYPSLRDAIHDVNSPGPSVTCTSGTINNILADYSTTTIKSKRAATLIPSTVTDHFPAVAHSTAAATLLPATVTDSSTIADVCTDAAALPTSIATDYTTIAAVCTDAAPTLPSPYCNPSNLCLTNLTVPPVPGSTLESVLAFRGDIPNSPPPNSILFEENNLLTSCNGEVYQRMLDIEDILNLDTPSEICDGITELNLETSEYDQYLLPTSFLRGSDDIHSRSIVSSYERQCSNDDHSSSLCLDQIFNNHSIRNETSSSQLHNDGPLLSSAQLSQKCSSECNSLESNGLSKAMMINCMLASRSFANSPTEADMQMVVPSDVNPNFVVEKSATNLNANPTTRTNLSDVNNAVDNGADSDSIASEDNYQCDGIAGCDFTFFELDDVEPAPSESSLKAYLAEGNTEGQTTFANNVDEPSAASKVFTDHNYIVHHPLPPPLKTSSPRCSSDDDEIDVVNDQQTSASSSTRSANPSPWNGSQFDSGVSEMNCVTPTLFQLDSPDCSPIHDIKQEELVFSSPQFHSGAESTNPRVGALNVVGISSTTPSYYPRFASPAQSLLPPPPPAPTASGYHKTELGLKTFYPVTHHTKTPPSTFDVEDDDDDDDDDDIDMDSLEFPIQEVARFNTNNANGVYQNEAKVYKYRATVSIASPTPKKRGRKRKVDTKGEDTKTQGQRGKKSKADKDGSKCPSPKVKKTPAELSEQRKKHNYLEQARRYANKQHFEVLKSSIPEDMRKPRMPKKDILKFGRVAICDQEYNLSCFEVSKMKELLKNNRLKAKLFKVGGGVAFKSYNVRYEQERRILLNNQLKTVLNLQKELKIKLEKARLIK